MSGSVHSSTQSENDPITECKRVCKAIAGTLVPPSLNLSPLMDNTSCKAFLQSLLLLTSVHTEDILNAVLEEAVMSLKGASLCLTLLSRLAFREDFKLRLMPKTSAIVKAVASSHGLCNLLSANNNLLSYAYLLWLSTIYFVKLNC